MASVPAAVLMDRYSVPSNRVFGVSPILGRRGLIKSPPKDTSICWATFLQQSPSEGSIRKPRPLGSAHSKDSAHSKSSNNLEYSHSGDGSPSFRAGSPSFRVGSPSFRDGFGELSISELRAIAMPTPMERSKTAREKDLGIEAAAASESSPNSRGSRNPTTKRAMSESLQGFLQDGSPHAAARKQRSSTAPALVGDWSICSTEQAMAAGFDATIKDVSLGSTRKVGLRRPTVGLRKMRSLEATDAPGGSDEDDDGAWSEAGARPNTVSGPSQGALHQKSRKRDPFMEYEDTEQKSQWERRWLLDDPMHLAARVRGLRHHAVHARLVQRAVLPPEADEGEAKLPKIQSGKAKKMFQATQPLAQTQALGSSMRQKERNELASVKSLKVMQKQLLSSSRTIEDNTRIRPSSEGQLGSTGTQERRKTAHLQNPGHMRAMLEDLDLSKHQTMKKKD